MPGDAAARLGICPWHAGQVERHANPRLHRIRRYQALPPSAAFGRHRFHGPCRRPDRHLSRPDAARGARGDQARVHDRPQETPAPHPDCHRRGPRGAQSPDPLLEPVSLRRALEPQPPGAAQWPYRPQASAPAGGLLPLFRLRGTQGGPHPRSAGEKDRKDQAGIRQLVTSARNPAVRDPEARHPAPRHRRHGAETGEHEARRRKPRSRRCGTGGGPRAARRPQGTDSSAPESARGLKGMACPAGRPFPLRHLLRPKADAHGPVESPPPGRRLG